MVAVAQAEALRIITELLQQDLPDPLGPNEVTVQMVMESVGIKVGKASQMLEARVAAGIMAKRPALVKGRRVMAYRLINPSDSDSTDGG